MKREKVYKRIDQERDHQDVDHPYESDLTAGLIILDRLLDDAKNAVRYTDGGPEFVTVNVTPYIRQIAAFAVRLLEVYGAPKREG